MSIIGISDKVLPDDWISRIEKFDVDKSDLPKSLKPLCYKRRIRIPREYPN